MSQRKGRGFAGMDPARQREIASMGGRAAHESGRAHEWDSQEARHAGHLGGLAAHHHRRAAFHHETAAHHHRQAAQNRITGDEKNASMHTTAAGLHAVSAATAEKVEFGELLPTLVSFFVESAVPFVPLTSDTVGIPAPLCCSSPATTRLLPSTSIA